VCQLPLSLNVWLKLISFVDATRRGQCSLFGSVWGPSLPIDLTSQTTSSAHAYVLPFSCIADPWRWQSWTVQLDGAAHASLRWSIRARLTNGAKCHFRSNPTLSILGDYPHGHLSSNHLIPIYLS